MAEVGRVPDAPRHHAVAKLARVAGDVEVARHLDDAGPDGVHADVPRRKLDRQLAGEGDDRALGASVRRVARERRRRRAPT